MKLQVPFTMPLTRRMLSPLSPCAIPGNHRHAACHRCAEQQLNTVLRRQVEQLRAAKRKQLLVRCNHMLAGSQRSAQPALDRVQSADQFDDCVHIRRRQNIFHALSPDSIRGDKPRALMLTLALHAAIEDACDLNLVVRARSKNLRERTADRTEAKQTYPQICTPCLES